VVPMRLATITRPREFTGCDPGTVEVWGDDIGKRFHENRPVTTVSTGAK
jgi:hypothetical protein